MEVADMLQSAPIFSGLTKRQLARLARLARVNKYTSGDIIVQEGGDPGGFFIIMSGMAEVVKGAGKGSPRKDLQVLATLVPGHFFGEIALIENLSRSATVRALGDTECVVIWRSDFKSELKRYPEVAVEMLSVVCRRLWEVEEKFVEVPRV